MEFLCRSPGISICDFHSNKEVDALFTVPPVIPAHENKLIITPKYFKGKAWQAADTEKMSDMYLLAKKSAEEKGVQIINCTEGGKLELFPRSRLQDEVSKGNRKTIYDLGIEDMANIGTVCDAQNHFNQERYGEALMVYNYLAKQHELYENAFAVNRYLSLKKLMKQNN